MYTALRILSYVHQKKTNPRRPQLLHERIEAPAFPLRLMRFDSGHHFTSFGSICRYSVVFFCPTQR